MNWLGDYPEDYTTVVCMFTTHDGNGAPVAPLTAFEAADVKIYKNGVNTEKTTTNGVTMTSPFDSLVGLHCIVIDTSNDTGDTGFWTTGGGGVYTLVLNPDTETVNGQTALKVIGQFGIALSPALRPTVAGRTLDVTATGAAGLDWGNVENLTTTNALTNTTIATTQKVDVETIKTKAVVNGGTVTFPTDATLASTTNITAGTITTATNVTTVDGLAANVITATSINDGAITAPKIADGAIDAATFASGALDAVWSTAARTLTAWSFQLPSNGLANVTAWTVAITGDITGNLSGSVGSVTGLTASNLDVAVSSRLAAVSYTAPDNTAITAIDARLPSDPADASDIADAFTALQSHGDGAWATATGFSTLDAAGVRSAVGLASANLDTQIDALPTNTDLATALAGADDATLAAIAALNNLSAAQVNTEVDTAIADAALATAASLAATDGKVDDIKTATDQIAFTEANKIDANILSVNSVTVNGDGAGTPWGP